jgi:biotin carboxyl carrier protein
MPYEVKLNGRTANVELISRAGDKVLVAVDGKEYELDFVKVSPDSFSVLYRNKSYNLELIPQGGIKKYLVNTFNNTYEVQIIDAEAKYLASRRKGLDEEGESVITAPIPGRVIRILVEQGEEVEAGQTVIVISAMKMESDFKAPRTGRIAEIRVKEGQTVEARQVMVVIE